MNAKPSTSKRERQVRKQFEKHGGGDTFVQGEAGRWPTFLATYGWSVSYGLPEFIVFGSVPQAPAWGEWLDHIATSTEPGSEVADAQVWPMTVSGRPVISRMVHPSNFTDDWFEDALLCRYIVGEPPLTYAHQLFWPDRFGKYPWTWGASDTTRWIQPPLYRPNQRKSDFVRAEVSLRQHAEFLSASRPYDDR